MEPIKFYQERLKEITAELKRCKSRLRLLSTMRLLVFVAMGTGVWLFFGNTTLIVVNLVVGILLFAFLVSRYASVQRQFQFTDELRKINEVEILRIHGDLRDAPTGNQFIYEEHDFNQDIDLFGQGSLFQWMDRTALKNGQKMLAEWFNSNDINQIEEKQKAIQELKDWTVWRQEYTATAALIQSDLHTEDVLNWMRKHKAFTPKIFGWFPLVFSIISALALVALSLGLIAWIPFVIWMFVGLGITGPFVSRITNMYNITSKIDVLLRQYSKLLEKIEQSEFHSQLLNTWKQEIQTSGRPASAALKELSQQVDALGNRNNFISAIFGNGLLLWDLRCTYRIEKWIHGFDGALHEWFVCVERIDAMNSLANYAYNHPNYCLPRISENLKLQLNAEAIGHPLLDPSKMVTNDVRLNQQDFFIITGANMAGKSTFLRTVAMNIVMANSGLPVCAKSFEYTPVKLISSMRTSDSLVNDESYFFSELKRLKFIVDTLEKDTYFIILDEILKGTNSVDKAEGSKKFVKRLVASNSTGLIATHDLSLCSLADDYPEVKNHYFDAEIVDDELFFDYRFKDGICQNMNASFLLRKMQIVED